MNSHKKHKVNNKCLGQKVKIINFIVQKISLIIRYSQSVVPTYKVKNLDLKSGDTSVIALCAHTCYIPNGDRKSQLLKTGSLRKNKPPKSHV